MADEPEYERTLCQLPFVHVFKIPARKSAEGHRAADWPKDPSWTGKLKIVAKGKVASVILLDDKLNTFAMCHVTDDSAVERTLDSGRYFVLRITNAQGRHAFIGIAFNERNDAFDFNVALSEFRGEVEREEQASKQQANGLDTSVTAIRDLSLKEGEKIHIKINSKKKQYDEHGNEIVQPVGGNTHNQSFTGKLPPPKKGGLLAPPPKDRGNAAPAPPGGSFPKSSATGAVNVQAATGSSFVATHPTASSVSASTSDGFAQDPFGDDPFATAASSSSGSTGCNTSACASESPTVFGFGPASTTAAAVSATDPFGMPAFGGTSSAADDNTRPLPPAKPAKPDKPPKAAATGASAVGNEANLLDL